jgi:uncharacterized phage protein gp47/JayE
MAGLTADGFTIKTISEIQEEMAADLRARLGPELDTSAESVMGQIIGAFAEREASVWLAARDVWQAFTPAGASGVSLTQLSLITGTLREDETRSRVTATLNLNAGITVPAGSRVRVVTDETAVFETLEDVTNAGGSPAYVDAVMQAVDAGPVRANAGTLTVIVTPVSGWNSATNAEDADMGLAAELDPELRARRERELRVQGSANIDAIEQDVLQVEGVIDARGFENDTDNTVGDLPPHSFRIVIWDGDPEAANDDEIAQAIWDSKPIGIEDVGADFGFALDRRGDNQTVQFARAALAEVYLEFDVEVDSSKFPADGADQIEAAVVAYADENWRIGEDVILSALYAAVFSVSGVRRIAAVRAGLAPSPVGTSDLTVGDDEIARADTGRILVNVS